MTKQVAKVSITNGIFAHVCVVQEVNMCVVLEFKMYTAPSEALYVSIHTGGNISIFTQPIATVPQRHLKLLQLRTTSLFKFVHCGSQPTNEKINQF